MKKYNLKAHLIFVCKYRKKLLSDLINEDIKLIFRNISLKSNFCIDIMETDLDHIHLIVSYPPNISISSIVRKLKQESTITIWKLHNEVLKRSYWKENTFWSDGYFVNSIGNASIETVKEYIKNQGN